MKGSDGIRASSVNLPRSAAFLSFVFCLDLRRDVVGRAAGGVQQIAVGVVRQRAQTEVRNLEIPFGREQQIFGL